MADINNIQNLDDLKEVVQEYLVTPRRPAVTGEQLGIIMLKTIELLSGESPEPIEPLPPTDGQTDDDNDLFTFKGGIQ